MSNPIDVSAAQLILRRYDILPAKDSDVKRSRETYEANVGGYKRDDGRKMLTVTIGNVSESRPCPFHNGESRDIVRRLCARHVLPRRQEFEEMLAGLVARAASMFDRESIDGFILERVSLDNSHYTIGAVHMVAGRN